jgi:hypothetical protein
MPSTEPANGHKDGGPRNYLDHSRAMEYLESDFAQGDGLDAKTLMDSRLNGGLTYNDFLVLPGYIGVNSAASPDGCLTSSRLSGQRRGSRLPHH